MTIRYTTAGARFKRRERLDERAREEEALLHRALEGRCSKEEVVRQLKIVVAERNQARADLFYLQKRLAGKEKKKSQQKARMPYAPGRKTKAERYNLNADVEGAKAVVDAFEAQKSRAPATRDLIDSLVLK